jgi:hypothetical protein
MRLEINMAVPIRSMNNFIYECPWIFMEKVLGDGAYSSIFPHLMECTGDQTRSHIGNHTKALDRRPQYYE